MDRVASIMTFHPVAVLLKEAGDTNWLLLERLKYTDRGGTSYEIPHPYEPPRFLDFETDLASVPAVCTWIMPRYGLHTKAALIHDHLCRQKDCDRFKADRIFRFALKDLGVGAVRRYFMGWAVTWGSIVGTAFTKLRTYLLLLLAFIAFTKSPWWTTFPRHLAKWEPAICDQMPPYIWSRPSSYACWPLSFLGTVLAWLLVALLPFLLAVILGSLTARPKRIGDIFMTLVATVLASPILLVSLAAFLISLLYRGFGGSRRQAIWSNEIRPLLDVPRYVLSGSSPSSPTALSTLPSAPVRKALKPMFQRIVPKGTALTPRQQRIRALFDS
jgi:hypothetical protein